MTAADQKAVARLRAKINRAPDFGYDDEAVELNQILAKYGKAWKWGRDAYYNEVVEVYTV